MRIPVRRSLRLRGRLLPLLSVALLALLLAPYGANLAAPARGESTAFSPAPASSITGLLTWNGVDTSQHPDPSSAIDWTFTNVSTVVFSWTGPAGGPGVSQAFLVVVLFGSPVYTKQQVESQPLPSTGGHISMTYDLTQFKWYLQGLYQVHGYLEDPSGNSIWSQTFYLRVAQPYDIVVVTVGLLALTVAELYMIATVGPRAADKVRKKQRTQPPEGEKAETPAETATTPETAATPPEKS